MIPCTLRRCLRKYHKHDIKLPPRYGTYVQSFYHAIKGYGKKAWAVSVEMDLDYAGAAEAYADEEIIKKCIEYLNTPPKSKYGKRRKRKLPYGKFAEAPYRFWVKEDKGSCYLQAILVVGTKTHPKFWGEGPLL